METPLISVVLPVYNGARYIEESIQSVIAQTYPNWELIIYDAASKDNTLEVLDQIWKKYPILQTRGQIIKDTVKVNVPKSLNLGFANARGDYLAWTSDDNRYLPEAFSKLMKALQDHPEASLVYGHSYKIDSKGDRTGILHSMPLEHLVYGNNVGLCFMYKKEVPAKINGYDETMFLVEDYDFWMRASEHFKFHHLDEVLYEIRYHGASLTENNQNKMYYLSEDVFERDFPGMKKWLPPVWIIRGHLRLLKTAIAQKNWDRVVRNLKGSLEVSPVLTAQEAGLKLMRGLAKLQNKAGS